MKHLSKEYLSTGLNHKQPELQEILKTLKVPASKAELARPSCPVDRFCVIKHGTSDFDHLELDARQGMEDIRETSEVQRFNKRYSELRGLPYPFVLVYAVVDKSTDSFSCIAVFDIENMNPCLKINHDGPCKVHLISQPAKSLLVAYRLTDKGGLEDITDKVLARMRKD